MQMLQAKLFTLTLGLLLREYIAKLQTEGTAKNYQVVEFF
jgi:hypothetical protein